jgi:8-oxo-dGTP pyrophosphatase MutT (NUDIX family)
VLVPLYVKDGRHFLVFTRRSSLVHHHKGEISFPGGGYNNSDGSLRQTALRESFEEIGLDPEHVDILGELDDTPTLASNFVITPFVGLIPSDYKYAVNDFEIVELIHIPAESLMAEVQLSDKPNAEREGHQFKPDVFEYQDKKITGATGRILKQFLEFYLKATI